MDQQTKLYLEAVCPQQSSANPGTYKRHEMESLPRERKSSRSDQQRNYFQGISSKSFDGSGNYSLGLEEQLMFPEIDYDKIDQVRGMDISIITTAKNDAQGFALLKEFGMPFKEK